MNSGVIDELKEFFIDRITSDEKLENGIILVGIGTDRLVGDLFGSTVAQLAMDKNFKVIEIRGHYDDLFHALNIEEKANMLDKNKIIIAVDAAMSSNKEKQDLVFLTVDDGILPGAGVDKKLTKVGDHSIKYTVPEKNFFSNVIRFGDVYKAAKKTVEMLVELDNRASEFLQNNKNVNLPFISSIV